MLPHCFFLQLLVAKCNEFSEKSVFITCGPHLTIIYVFIQTLKCHWSSVRPFAGLAHCNTLFGQVMCLVKKEFVFPSLSAIQMQLSCGKFSDSQGFQVHNSSEELISTFWESVLSILLSRSWYVYWNESVEIILFYRSELWLAVCNEIQVQSVNWVNCGRVAI